MTPTELHAIVGFKHAATLPGKIVWIASALDGIAVYYENPRKWWQFWKKPIAVHHISSSELAS